MPKSTMPDFVQQQNQFIDQRPTLSAHNNDPLAIVELLRAEIDEFEEAYTLEHSPEEIAREAADICIFVITLFKTLGLDMPAEVTQKIARNDAKYPAELFQSESYEIGAAIAKKRWISLGGDKKFYETESINGRSPDDTEEEEGSHE